MSFVDKLNLSASDKRKVEDLNANSEADLVGMIRAAEDACRNHLGSAVVDEILNTFKAFDKGIVEPGKFGAFY